MDSHDGAFWDSNYEFENSTELNQSKVTDTFDYKNFDFSSFCQPELNKLGHCIVLFVVTLFGLIGNLSLLFVIVFSKHLHSAPNILIVNLAISDLVYILGTAPFNIRHELIACWLLGSAACKVKHYLPIVAQAACIFSLVALSRERYNAIVKGLESRVKQQLIDHPMFVVFLSWVFGCLIGIPVFLLTKTTTFGLLCVYMSMTDKNAQLYVVFLFFILYVVPFFIIAFHYTQLARTLCRTSIVTLMGNESSIQQIQTRRRLALIVLTITVFFGLFWLPYHVYHIWFMFTKYHLHIMSNKKQIQLFRHIFNYMSLANSCLNPWIVFVMSSAHRRCIASCLCRSHCSTKVMVRRIASWRVRSASIHTMSTSLRNDAYQSPVRTALPLNSNEHTF